MLEVDGILGSEGGGGVSLKASGDAGSGQLYYLGYRGAIYLCGLTCLCRLGSRTPITLMWIYLSC